MFCSDRSDQRLGGHGCRVKHGDGDHRSPVPKFDHHSGLILAHLLTIKVQSCARRCMCRFSEQRGCLCEVVRCPLCLLLGELVWSSMWHVKMKSTVLE